MFIGIERRWNDRGHEKMGLSVRAEGYSLFGQNQQFTPIKVHEAVLKIAQRIQGIPGPIDNKWDFLAGRVGGSTVPHRIDADARMIFLESAEEKVWTDLANILSIN